MSSETVEEVENEEATEPTITEIIETTNEEEPTEQIKQEETLTPPVEQTTEQTQPSPKAKAKAEARRVKVVELVECQACNKKMLPKSLRNTHPHYCKRQPTETLPVNKQKASYGSKVEQKLRKEIEEEMKAKYANKENDKNAQNVKNEVVQYSQPIEVKTKAKPSVPSVPSVQRQLTATELLQQSYNEVKKLRQQERAEKIASFKSKMF